MHRRHNCPGDGKVDTVSSFWGGPCFAEPRGVVLLHGYGNRTSAHILLGDDSAEGMYAVPRLAKTVVPSRGPFRNPNRN